LTALSSHQNLPVPIGGLAAVHVRASSLARFWRRRLSLLIPATALFCAASGALLTVLAPPAAIYADGVAVHFADSTLVRVAVPALPGARMYTGDVTLVILAQSDGTTRASAATSLSGQPASGTCRLSKVGGPPVEKCTFMWGARTLTATDRYDVRRHTWQRRFGDGAETRFSVPAGMTLIPIPLPLGHS
jgi:hypothetical protein